MPDLDLAELKRLESAATPGEWFGWMAPSDTGRCDLSIDKDGGRAIAFFHEPNADANRYLAIAARNALPALIEMAERVQELECENAALRRKLVDLLSRYAVHHQPCRDVFTHAVSMRMPLPGCICGYDSDVLPVIEGQRDG